MIIEPQNRSMQTLKSHDHKSHGQLDRRQAVCTRVTSPV